MKYIYRCYFYYGCPIIEYRHTTLVEGSYVIDPSIPWADGIGPMHIPRVLLTRKVHSMTSDFHIGTLTKI